MSKPPTPPTICSRCSKRLGPQVVRAVGKQFHPACFVCDSCKKPLEKSFVPRGERLYHGECHDKLFTPKCSECGLPIQGSYTKDERGRYHTDCYRQLHNLVCSLCQEAIEGSYLYDGWGQKAHPEHDQHPTGQCHVCARLMSPAATTGSKVLSDGRLLCSFCHSAEIHDFRQIQAAKLDVIAQMQAVGFDYIPDYIQVKLDEDQQLVNQRLRASATGNIHGYTRTAQRNIPGYGLILEHGIHVLSGLPKVAFKGVLAHELLHVWINERPLKHLSHEQVEGFCNLGSALICQNALKHEGDELARVLLQRMDEDPDPAYGNGYRAMAWRLEQMGWPALLQALQNPDIPLPEPEASVTQPRAKQAYLPPTAAPFGSAQGANQEANPKTMSSAEKLAEIKAKLDQQRMQNKPAAAAASPSPAAPSSPRPLSRLSSEAETGEGSEGSKPDVDPEVARKIRERFAQKGSPKANIQSQKPAQKPGTGPSGKLGKLKKPGKS
ncbi:MAG: protein DA1 [Candidatus Sericytochromatia bacterium]